MRHSLEGGVEYLFSMVSPIPKSRMEHDNFKWRLMIEVYKIM